MPRRAFGPPNLGVFKGNERPSLWNDHPLTQWYISETESDKKQKKDLEPQLVEQPSPKNEFPGQNVIQTTEQVAFAYDQHVPDAPSTWATVDHIRTGLEDLAVKLNQACVQGDATACLRMAEAWRTSGNLIGLVWGSNMENAPGHIPPEVEKDYAVLSLSGGSGMFNAGGALVVDRCGTVYVCGQFGAGVGWPSLPVGGYISSGEFGVELSCSELREELSGWSGSMSGGLGAGGGVMQPIYKWSELFSCDFSSPRAIESGFYTLKEAME